LRKKEVQDLNMSEKMGLGVFLRYLRLVQILLVAIISLSLAASFLKVGSKQLGNNGTPHPTVHGTGIVALLFGLTSIAELFMEAAFVRKPHCILSHALSLGMAIFLNIFGIVLTMGSAHVIARLPELFDRELIYLAIGCIFVSLMIENFAQGRSFHMVVEVESNKADMMEPKHFSKDIIHAYGMEKTASSAARTKAAKKRPTEMVNRATESPNQAEKATNTVLSARKAQNNLNLSNTVLSAPLSARKSRNNLNCSNIEINTAQTPCRTPSYVKGVFQAQFFESEEVFTTPSVIPTDIRLSISDKELDTAKKCLRKLSMPDSIFKMKTASYSTLSEFPSQNTDTPTHKGYIVNDTDDVCLSINESVVEVEPLPEVTTLRASGIWLHTRSMQSGVLTDPLTGCAPTAAAAAAVQADIESAVQDKKSYSPTLVPETPNAYGQPLTPSIYVLEAPFHSKLELTPTLMPKTSDCNSNSIENTPNNTHQFN